MASSSGLVITRASYTTQGNRSSSLGKGMIKDTDEHPDGKGVQGKVSGKGHRASMSSLTVHLW